MTKEQAFNIFYDQSMTRDDWEREGCGDLYDQAQAIMINESMNEYIERVENSNLSGLTRNKS